MPQTKCTTVHLRITIALRDAIAARAAAERRPWTQMAIIMLQDAEMQRCYDNGLTIKPVTKQRKSAA